MASKIAWNIVLTITMFLALLATAMAARISGCGFSTTRENVKICSKEAGGSCDLIQGVTTGCSTVEASKTFPKRSAHFFPGVGSPVAPGLERELSIPL